MYLFTWNVQRSKVLAEIALAHLERVVATDNVAATFQEWPKGISLAVGSRLRMLTANSKAVIVHSDKLKTVGGPVVDASGRAIIARLRVKTGLELNCVGVHWHSRLTTSELGDDPYRRGGAAALFRHHLDATLQSKFGGTKQTVIMGDFNASPTDHRSEIGDKYCFFASHPTNRRSSDFSLMGTVKDEWYSLEPDVDRDLGTHYWKSGKRWLVADHVFVTHDLQKQVGRPVVLSSLLGASGVKAQQFLTRSRVPRGKKYSSDHLPVTCTLQYNP